MNCFIVLTVLLLAVTGCVNQNTGPYLTNNQGFVVARVVDGDTLELNDGSKVRLLGINTPETTRNECYSAQAKDFLKTLVEGKTVTLESDVEDKDVYGRLLRYVSVDGVFVNLELVKAGFAVSEPFQPNTARRSEFDAAEKKARASHVGMWKPSSVNNMVVSLFDAQNEVVVLKNTGTESVGLTGWLLKDKSASNYHVFSALTLDSQETVTLYSDSKGTSNDVNVYWSSKPVWNNDFDSAYLWNADCDFVAGYDYNW